MCQREMDIDFASGNRVHEFDFSFIPAPEQKKVLSAVGSDDDRSCEFEEKYNDQYGNQKEDNGPLFDFMRSEQLLNCSDFLKVLDSPRMKRDGCFADEFCRIFSGGHTGRLNRAMQLIQVGEDGFYHVIRNIIRQTLGRQYPVPESDGRRI